MEIVMKKYVVIERGSRGEFENVYVENSELNIEEFCRDWYEKEIKKEKEGLSEEESLEFDEYVEEFGGVSMMVKSSSYEVCLNEELSYEVYEVVV
jgi:hypothetical protein